MFSFLKKIHFSFFAFLIAFICLSIVIRAEEEKKDDSKKIETITTLTEQEKIVENKTQDKDDEIKKTDTKNENKENIKDNSKTIPNMPKLENENKDKNNNNLPLNNLQKKPIIEKQENNKNEENKKIEPELLEKIQNQIIEQSEKQEQNEQQKEQLKIDEQTNKINEEIKKEEEEKQKKETEVEQKKQELEKNIEEENNKEEQSKEKQVEKQNVNNKKGIQTKEEKKKENIDLDDDNEDDDKQDKSKNEKSKKVDNKKTNKKEKKDNILINIDKLFTRFDKKKALDFDYNKITYNNFMLLENVEELKEIKQAIKNQNDVNFMKKKEIENRNKNNLSSQAIFEKPIENVLRISSLVYFNDKDWRARVNGVYVNSQNKDTVSLKDVSVVKTNKISMIFLLKKPNDKIKEVREIQKKGGSYNQNYYIVQEGKDTYIAFKLFIGQKINLDTMKITG